MSTRTTYRRAGNEVWGRSRGRQHVHKTACRDGQAEVPACCGVACGQRSPSPTPPAPRQQATPRARTSSPPAEQTPQPDARRTAQHPRRSARHQPAATETRTRLSMTRRPPTSGDPSTTERTRPQRHGIHARGAHRESVAGISTPLPKHRSDVHGRPWTRPANTRLRGRPRTSVDVHRRPWSTSRASSGTRRVR